MSNLNKTRVIARAAARRNFAQGFTLIEVMISVFVLSVGILGMAGMQAVSVRETVNTTFRIQADMLAADMADRLRANRAAATNATSTSYESDGSALGSPSSCIGPTANCNEADLASHDISNWQTHIGNSNLPMGVGTITRAAGTSEYTILVFWDEDRDGAVTTATSCNAASGDGCIRLVVEI